MSSLIHLFCPLHSPTGGVTSALALAGTLQPACGLSAWSLPVEPGIDDGVRARFLQLGLEVRSASPVPDLPAGTHLFFHLGEYPLVFDRDADAWRPVLERAGSVQFSVNFNIGSLPRHHWLGDCLSAIYFQNREMVGLWRRKMVGTSLEEVPVVVLPPPVDIEPFLATPDPDQDRLVIGLLSGSSWLARDVVGFYERLADSLPDAEFWFMPTPAVIRKHFGDHPRFRLFEQDEIPVIEFITAMDVYCFPSDINAQTLQGTRTLVEIMAAGRPPVMADRLGPRDRIVHGESGFVTNHLEQMVEHVVTLARDAALRRRIGRAARERARGWPVSAWRDAILSRAVS